MANPTYLIGVNPSAVPNGPLKQILVLTSDITGGGSSTVSVNGNPVSNPNFNDTTPVADGGFTLVRWKFDGSGNVSAEYATSGTTTAFGQVTSGTNTSQTLIVGTS